MRRHGAKVTSSLGSALPEKTNELHRNQQHVQRSMCLALCVNAAAKRAILPDLVCLSSRHARTQTGIPLTI